MIKNQNQKILILEEQIQRKDLENIKNQVEMERRVLENTRQVANTMLNQTEGFRYATNYSAFQKQTEFIDNKFEKGMNYMSETPENTHYFTPKGSVPANKHSRKSSGTSQILVNSANEKKSPEMEYGNNKIEEDIESKNRVSTQYQTGRSEGKHICESSFRDKINENASVSKTNASIFETDEKSQLQNVIHKLPEFKNSDDKVEEYKSEQESDSSEAEYTINKEFSQLPEKYKGIQEGSKESSRILHQTSPKIKGTPKISAVNKNSLTEEDLILFNGDLNDEVTYTKTKSGVTTKFYTSGK